MSLPVFIIALLAATLALLAFSPALDIGASALFYNTDIGGFWLRENPLALFAHEAIQWGMRAAGLMLALIALSCLVRKRAVFGLTAKTSLFLLAALAIGPGLITNTVLKDNWHRARPVQITEFGGSATYSPPFVISDQCEKNCSFIAGDGASGFFLHTLFYVVPPRWRKRAFWGGFAGGGLIFGGNRLIMGGHFLSDIIASGLFMLVISALVHASFYGWRTTKQYWCELIKR